MPLALRAARLLAEDFDVAADVWSAPGWQRLRQDALDCEEWNRLHPTEEPRKPLVTRTFEEVEGPIVAVSDWMKLVPDQISRWVPRPYLHQMFGPVGQHDEHEHTDGKAMARPIDPTDRPPAV